MRRVHLHGVRLGTLSLGLSRCLDSLLGQLLERRAQLAGVRGACGRARLKVGRPHARLLGVQLDERVACARFGRSEQCVGRRRAREQQRRRLHATRAVEDADDGGDGADADARGVVPV